MKAKDQLMKTMYDMKGNMIFTFDGVQWFSQGDNYKIKALKHAPANMEMMLHSEELQDTAKKKKEPTSKN